VIQHARRHPDKHPWIIRLLSSKPAKVVAVAVANKMAGIAWAIMAKGGTYRTPGACGCRLKGLGNGNWRHRRRMTIERAVCRWAINGA
jgi:hypothetical protein